MRLRHCLIVAIIPVLAVVAGCSSNEIQSVILQNPMPLEAGTQLRYNFRITTYFGDQTWVNTGQFTRRVVGQQQITVDGESFSATVVEDDYPAIAAPNIPLQPTDPLKLYAERLFAPDGGLADWMGYFRQRDHNNDGQVDQVVRSASGPSGGGYTEVPEGRPHLWIPFQIGYASNNSYPLTSIPMYTNNPTLSDSTCLFNSQYRKPIRIAGESRVQTTLTQRVEADITFDGYTGPCTGVIKTSLAEDLGPTQKDIDLEFRLAGHWLRVHILISNVQV